MPETMTIQVRGRGTLTLPATLREKYRLGEGDLLTVVDLDGAVLLSPRLLVVPRLAAEMERLRRARKLSLKDLGGRLEKTERRQPPASQRMPSAARRSGVGTPLASQPRRR